MFLSSHSLPATPRLHRPLLTLAGLGLLLAPLPGCQNINAGSDAAQLRVIDASPNAPSIDIYEAGSILAYGLTFGTVTTYVPINPGNYGVVVNQNKTSTQLATQQATFAINSDYTVLVGNYASSLQEVILKDQSTAAPSGNISVRFLDESTTVGAVDLYLVASGSTLSATKPVQTAVTFNANSGYINVPSGTYTLIALPTGTVPTSATANLIATSPATAYAGGAARTFVLINNPLTTSPTLQVLTLDDFDSPSAT